MIQADGVDRAEVDLAQENARSGGERRGAPVEQWVAFTRRLSYPVTAAYDCS